MTLDGIARDLKQSAPNERAKDRGEMGLYHRDLASLLGPVLAVKDGVRTVCRDPMSQPLASEIGILAVSCRAHNGR